MTAQLTLTLVFGPRQLASGAEFHEGQALEEGAGKAGRDRRGQAVPLFTGNSISKMSQAMS